MTTPNQAIHVPSVPPPQRHPLIFGRFDALSTGQSFELMNDHDPVPLQRQFERTRAGQFAWKYLEAGPSRWHVRIARVAAGTGQPTPGCADTQGGGCACSGG
jgi:uncharacterized protein (DUF2249 family)